MSVNMNIVERQENDIDKRLRSRIKKRITIESEEKGIKSGNNRMKRFLPSHSYLHPHSRTEFLRTVQAN